MKTASTLLGLLLALSISSATADEVLVSPSRITTELGDKGRPVDANASAIAGQKPLLDNLPNDQLPISRLSKIAQQVFTNAGSQTRSAKDAQIYREVSPSVVLIVTKEGLGSGSLIGSSGDVITNWHVVKGYSTVAVVFKPTVEGRSPTRDDMRVGQVVGYDQVADLALIKVSGVQAGRNPIRLGDSSEISIGSDVHAIGHPTGEAWTYTTGVISQYRLAYEWQAEGDNYKHKADIIQTQTPINPGNSGGPLISDSGHLIGVNSFKASGEGLNFAVSVDDVKHFLTRPGNRGAQPSPKKADCEPRELSRFRSKTNDATVVSLDMFCTGRATGENVIPDNPTEPIYLKVDRNGDGKADVIFFDLKRRGKIDMSWWDENFDGHWTLVGYHDDGGPTPTRFESFSAYRRRMAGRQ